VSLPLIWFCVHVLILSGVSNVRSEICLVDGVHLDPAVSFLRILEGLNSSEEP